MGCASSVAIAPRPTILGFGTVNEFVKLYDRDQWLPTDTLPLDIMRIVMGFAVTVWYDDEGHAQLETIKYDLEQRKIDPNTYMSVDGYNVQDRWMQHFDGNFVAAVWMLQHGARLELSYYSSFGKSILDAFSHFPLRFARHIRSVIFYSAHITYPEIIQCRDFALTRVDAERRRNAKRDPFGATYFSLQHDQSTVVGTFEMEKFYGWGCRAKLELTVDKQILNRRLDDDALSSFFLFNQQVYLESQAVYRKQLV